MFAKIQITGRIEVLTGMHIGGNGAFAAIGAVDSPVIKDSISNLPLLPGSSLKGKMRTLLAKAYNEKPVAPDQDDERLLRLFGSANKNHVHAGRLQFSDMVLSNAEQLHKRDVESMTEIKFENSINRQTAVATPRQIERVIRGAEFELNLIYECTDKEEFVTDMKILSEGMKLLELDYIGGSGSRGYGKVKFHDIEAVPVFGDVEDSIMEQMNGIFAEI
ncbi:MAG: type III-A CRISPR-associated RAMP protein Csm3 [Parasporobacterium sp.]|nr:type III-A CRISPR-associated RAMP protein Csm3 [Parasporobacterium sp.]